MKIVFMGTPEFAVPTLEKLISEHEVVCVYTRAPKEAGRGKIISKSPVHLVAEAHGIEVRTPRTLRDTQEVKKFKMLNADISVVAAYGLILPVGVIEAFPQGCLNVHASLLPRWRGAAPIQRCIEAGDAQSGVTIMRVVEALDAGEMLKKRSVTLTPSMTGGALHDCLSALGADLMMEVLAHIDQLISEPQNDKFVTYAAKISKSECQLNFNLSAEKLERKIRAFNPFPATYFEYEGERFKVLEAEVEEGSGKPGEILKADEQLCIACREKVLHIKQIQRQGKQILSTSEFLKGFSFKPGTVLA